MTDLKTAHVRERGDFAQMRKTAKPTSREKQLQRRKPSRTVRAPKQLSLGLGEPSSRGHFDVERLPDEEFRRVVQEISAATDQGEARKIVEAAGLKKGQFSGAQMEQLRDIYAELPK